MAVLDRFSLKVLITGGAAAYGVPVWEAVAEAGATTIVADIVASRDPNEPLQMGIGAGLSCLAITRCNCT